MISRYTRPEMAAIWTDEKKFECWLAVELAADEAWAKLDIFQPKMSKIKAKC